MVIVVVTMIKDMLVSMYRKRKDKKWLRSVFNKKIEGFEGECGSGTIGTTCDKLKYLLCNTNFNKLKKYIDADIIKGDFVINTGGRSIFTNGGHISTDAGMLSVAPVASFKRIVVFGDTSSNKNSISVIDGDIEFNKGVIKTGGIEILKEIN